MQEMHEFFLDTRFFSFKFYLFFFNYWFLNNVTLLTAFYVTGVRTSAKKSLLTALVMTVFSLIVRRYILPPYSMAVVHFGGWVLMTVFYKTPFLVGFVGMFFSLVVFLMGGAALSYNFVILNYMHLDKLVNIPCYVCLVYLEYGFNFLYIILVKKYPQLTLKSIFYED